VENTAIQHAFQKFDLGKKTQIFNKNPR